MQVYHKQREVLAMKRMRNATCSMNWLILVSFAVLTIVLIISYTQYIHHYNYRLHTYRLQERFDEPSIDIDDELNAANITFLDKASFKEELSVSLDYFKGMNKADLWARGEFETSIEYMEHYVSSYVKFTDEEKKLVLDATLKANQLISKYPKLKSIPWKFAKVDSDIEGGWPHTHNTMIVLTKKTLKKPFEELVETLIHEKLHVYQRIYEQLAYNLYVNMWSFKPAKGDIVSTDILSLMRSNPDVGSRIFIYNNQFYIAQLFNSLKPKSLSESRPYAISYSTPIYQERQPLTNEMLGIPADISCQLEHPNEIMACIVSHIIANPQYLENNKTTLQSYPMMLILMDWMRKHL